MLVTNIDIMVFSDKASKSDEERRKGYGRGYDG